VGSSTQPGEPGGWAILDPSVQAILDAPSVTYIPASAFKALVGLHVVPSPACALLDVQFASATAAVAKDVQPLVLLTTLSRPDSASVLCAPV